MRITRNTTYALLSIAAAVFSLKANGQVLGKVSNSKGEPIPFASVYIKEIMQGAPTSEKGSYILKLKPGSYNINFQAIGYKPQNRSIQVDDKAVTLNVTLEDATYELKEVVVSSKDNPADRIMRKAITNGQIFKSKLSSYTSDVYFKTNLKITKFSKIVKWLVPKEQKLPVEGKTYTMEIVNKLSYKTPNQYTQKTISMRTNFPDDDFSIPGLSIYRNNIYNETFFGAASPLGRSAFTFYKFQLVGSSQQNGNTTYKIAFSPRKSVGSYYSGTLYIVDNVYNITNAELTTTNTGIKYVFSISYEMINGTIPMPTTISSKMSGNIMGNIFGFAMTSSAKYTSVETKGAAAPKVVAAATKKTKKISKKEVQKRETIEKKIEELSSKDNLSMKEMRQMTALIEKKEELDDTLTNLEESSMKVVKDSLFNTQDSTFWNQVRPIPLSDEEIKYSHESDSISAKIPKGVAAPIDTTKNKVKWSASSALIGGTIYQKGSTSVDATGFVFGNSSYFTPVDGFTLANKFEFQTMLDTNHRLNIALKPMYSFARKTAMGNAGLRYDFSPRHKGYFTVTGSIATTDLNPERPIDKLPNTVAALFFKESYLKTIDTKGISAAVSYEVANGLNVKLGGTFNSYTLLDNQTNFSFLYKNAVYDSNKPSNLFDDGSSLSSYRQASLLLNVSYTPSPRYKYDYRGYKYYTSANKPTFNLKVKQGVGAYQSVSRHTQLELGVQQHVSVHMINNLRYTAKAGTFFNSDNLQLTDYYHPNTVYIPFGFTTSENAFILMPYYKYATPKSYAEGHATYEAQGILLKYLPFLSKKMFTENVSVGGYVTKRNVCYTEVGYGVGNILMMGGVSVAASFENGKYSGWGIKGYINLP